MCPECRREQFHDTQRELLDAQRKADEARGESFREAERQHEERLKAIREAEHRRFNPGDYVCDACKLKTLLAGASRCPVCHADVAVGYWPATFEREKRATEAAAAARKTADEAAAAAKKKLDDAKKRACDAAVATVRLGLEHTELLWQATYEEAKRKYEAQGFFSRIVASLSPPSNVRLLSFQSTGFDASATDGMWFTPPVFILGIVTVDPDRQLGFKHYRFTTPFEYIAVLLFLKTKKGWNMSVVDQAITEFQRVTHLNWRVREPRTVVGDAVAQDYAEELHRHRERAAQGDAISQREYGRMFANGYGVPQDYAEALKWYLQAAAQGDGVAKRNLGRMYANGQAVTKDYDTALKLYHEAADQGDPMATRLIGFMYANGQAVPQDYGEALKWYRKAAAQGDGWAQRNIGRMYHMGWGVAQDIQKAVRWYRKAADQEDAEVRFDAEFNLDLVNGKFDK
jgi:Sel1 repeat